MKCRYDDTHTGPFSNAVVLAQHYVEFHSDVYVPPVKQPCPVPDCGKEVTDVAQHLRKRHGITGKTAAVVPVDPDPVEQPRWTADHIVLPVVTELAGGKKGAVPVNKLASIFEWRDATQKMLDQVQ